MSSTCLSKEEKHFADLYTHSNYILGLIQKCTLPFKVCMFSEQKEKTEIKTNSPSVTTSQNASNSGSSKAYTQNNFKAVS